MFSFHVLALNVGLLLNFSQWRWTNLKAGGAHTFFVVCTSTFLAIQLQVFGERFRDGQYSLVSFVFAVLLLTMPPSVPRHL